jgi:phage repressor protein C with HTH and peptisase S24 domain
MSSNLSVQAFNLLNMKTLAERLKIALAQAGIKQIELARRVGVTRGAVSLWFKGTTTSLEGENLLKTAQILGVSPNWLSSGRGRMISTSAAEISLENNPDYPVVRRVKIKITESLTGFAVEPIDGDYAPIVFPRSWYEKNGFTPDSLIAICNPGAAMEPSLYNGDWVVVNTDDVAPRDGTAFAIGIDGETMVRRLFKSNGEWIAASDNADKRLYRDRPINGETFIIGRVVHKQSERI